VKFDHPRLLVVKFAECFRFYRDVVGLMVTWGDENDSYASFTDREGKEAVLALFVRQAMAETIGTGNLPADPGSPTQDRIALIIEAEELDAEIERMEAQGVQALSEPRDLPDWGICAAYLRDPDGNLIELNSPLAREQWSEGLQEAA
jgi:catechol 2,3-dioxygenase-like lactoylglutathione lyase family enzyme